jgi:hypothetical protein
LFCFAFKNEDGKEEKGETRGVTSMLSVQHIVDRPLCSFRICVIYFLASPPLLEIGAHGIGDPRVAIGMQQSRQITLNLANEMGPTIRQCRIYLQG